LPQVAGGRSYTSVKLRVTWSDLTSPKKRQKAKKSASGKVPSSVKKVENFSGHFFTSSIKIHSFTNTKFSGKVKKWQVLRHFADVLVNRPIFCCPLRPLKAMSVPLWILQMHALLWPSLLLSLNMTFCRNQRDLSNAILDSAL